MPNTKHITIRNFPTALWRQVKSQAAIEGKTVTKYLTELIKQTIQGKEN